MREMFSGERQGATRHGNVAKKVHYDLFKKNGIEHTEKWYEHIPEGAVGNEEVKCCGLSIFSLTAW